MSLWVSLHPSGDCQYRIWYQNGRPAIWCIMISLLTNSGNFKYKFLILDIHYPKHLIVYRAFGLLKRPQITGFWNPSTSFGGTLDVEGNRRPTHQTGRTKQPDIHSKGARYSMNTELGFKKISFMNILT